MKLRSAIVALAASPALGACAFGLHKYYDSQGHHHCSISDDEYHQDGTGHHHDQN